MAGFFSSLFGPSQKLSDPNHWLLKAVGAKSSSGIIVNEHVALNLPGVYACVRIISDIVAQLPAHVYRKTPDGRVAEPDHPVERLVARQPNPDTNAFSFRQTIQSNALLWGNGYTEIETTNGGERRALWQLRPENTEPKATGDGRRIVYLTSDHGERKPLDPDRVLHIKCMGHDPNLGMSPIRLHRETLGLALAAEKFGSKLFANDLRSGGFLQHPGQLTPEAAKNLKESKQSDSGTDNAFKVKVLEEGMKFIPTTIPPEDGQFLGTRQFQLAEFSRMYGVPLMLLSTDAAPGWASSVEQLMLAFITQTVQPWIVQWEQEMNRKLFTQEEREQGYFVRFAMQALMRGDMQTRASFYQTLAEVAGMDANEIRELEDMEPIRNREERQ